MPFDRFLNCVYSWLAIPAMAQGKLEELTMALEAPLPWEVKKKVDPKDWATEDSGFDAFMGALQAQG